MMDSSSLWNDVINVWGANVMDLFLYGGSAAYTCIYHLPAVCYIKEMFEVQFDVF